MDGQSTISKAIKRRVTVIVTTQVTMPLAGFLELKMVPFGMQTPFKRRKHTTVTPKLCGITFQMKALVTHTCLELHL
jgi:hypothetical protein